MGQPVQSTLNAIKNAVGKIPPRVQKRAKLRQLPVSIAALSKQPIFQFTVE